ncbi:MAG: TIM barrel protein, partial [Candidatus Brocadiales bacterium]
EKLIGLALDLRVRIITIGIGRVPEDETGRAHGRLREVLNEIGRRAENYDIHLASHVGASSPVDIKKMLDSLDTQGVGACYDPSVLIPMGLDAVEGVRELGSCIVHAYARDILKGERGYVETIPGQGIVPFRDYMLALLEAGYDGHLIIRREAGEGSVKDVIKAREFLEKLIAA